MSLNSARIILGMTPSQGMDSVNRLALLLAVPSIIRLQANRISVVVRPGLTQLANSEGGTDRAQRVSRLLVKVTGLLGAIAFAGVLLVNGPFVVRWVGSEFFAGDLENMLAATLVGLSIWVFGFKVLMEVRFAFKQRGIGFMIGGVVTVVASVALVADYGVAGALAAAILGEIVASAIWFVPSNMQWLLRRGARVRDAMSLVWLPVALVILSAVCAVKLSPIPASWGWIVVSSFLILIATGGSGLLWLGSDLSLYLRERRIFMR
jgi:hypothetical protein